VEIHAVCIGRTHQAIALPGKEPTEIAIESEATTPHNVELAIVRLDNLVE